MRTLAGAFAMLALAAVPMLPASRVLASADDLEYRVKAEFVERFTHFIDWPPTAFAGPNAPFVLCVVGRTPVATYLELLAQGRRLKDRPVELRRLGPTGDLSACHLVFIAPDERAYLKAILERLRGRPVVTVADSAGFARAGVLINLILDEQGRVRFEISPRSARSTALTLNAQLLKLSQQADVSE